MKNVKLPGWVKVGPRRFSKSLSDVRMKVYYDKGVPNSSWVGEVWWYGRRCKTVRCLTKTAAAVACELVAADGPPVGVQIDVETRQVSPVRQTGKSHALDALRYGSMLKGKQP